jgi:hypothetical protein
VVIAFPAGAVGEVVLEIGEHGVHRIERCRTERGVRIPLREVSVGREGIVIFGDAFEK